MPYSAKPLPSLNVYTHSIVYLYVFLLAGNGWPQGGDGLETADQGYWIFFLKRLINHQNETFIHFKK